MPRPRRALADRLWEKVAICVHGFACRECCWLYKNEEVNGYGTITFIDEDGQKQIIGTHRAAYLLTYGVLSETLMVLHKCPTGAKKRCCQPGHLRLGDSSENAQDLLASGWEPFTQKMSDDDIRHMRRLYFEGTSSQKQIATLFGLSLSETSDILRGRVHPTVGGPLKQASGKRKSHCHRGHLLSEDNIVFTKDGTIRNCKICYLTNNRLKAQRRLQTHHPLINAQRRARRGSTVHRFTEEEQRHIQHLYTAKNTSYRTLATMFDTTYSTIQRIVNGTYSGARYAAEASP